jgi:gliding motility-associated-like protein
LNLFRSETISKYLILGFTFVIFGIPSFAQPLNKYARITATYNLDPTDIDSVEVTDPSEFNVADTVLYIQMKGAYYWDPSNLPIEFVPGEFWGELRDDPNNNGIYCIMLINKIVDNTIIFTTALRDDIEPEEPGEVAQLVKVIGGKETWDINQDLTCDPWDPATGTGGVFAMIATRKIVLNANIDVTGKGFLGGDPNFPVTDYFEGVCNGSNNQFFLESDMDSAGRKGESIQYEGYEYTRGSGRMGTGGGGGNGKYMGGGGGGNFNWGGIGGNQAESCGIKTIQNAEGGKGFGSELYLNTGDNKNRIFLGGGAGTGTQNPDSGRLATAGGDGGGIIILITDTLEAKGGKRFIRANGESVSDTATAGAGGGGGGGVVVVDANTYLGIINVSANGGNGGWTNHPEPTGPGGSGGAGVIWHSGSSLPGLIEKSVSSGLAGQHVVAGSYGAIRLTNPGLILGDLLLPLRGLLFNVMPTDQDICENTEPELFIASVPKGGHIDSFRFEWSASPDQVNWTPAPGKNDSIYYKAGVLTDTIYFRRVVRLINLADTIVDTSGILTINVLPKLVDNDITSPDTICKYNTPERLYDPFPFISGSDMNRFDEWVYIWQRSIDSVTWVDEDIMEPYLFADPLDTTTHFRRIVNAYVCTDTSNAITIKVIEPIVGNIVVPDDTICEDEMAVPLTTENAISGAMGPGSYAYSWYTSENGTDFTLTGSIAEEFAPGILGDADTLYFRRWVISGPDSACIDTSNTAQIIVHAHITQNFIAGDDTLCADDKTLRLNQLSGAPGGGNLAEYLFRWEMKDQGGSWETAGGVSDLVYYEPGYLTDTSYFRRWITSGACIEVSNEVEIILQDSLLNNLVAGNDTICYGAIPATVADQPPDVTGGDRQNYAYWWEERSDETGWEVLAGESGKDLSPPALFDTTWFRRVVSSGKCIHYSDSVEIIVQALIGNNLITNGTQDETCYDSVLSLVGTNELTGGNRETYQFLWEKSTDDMNWSVVEGDSTAVSHTTNILFAPMFYRRITLSGACTDTTPSTHVLINPRPSGSLYTTILDPACYNSNGDPVEVTVPVSFDNGSYPFTITYTDGINPNNTAIVTAESMDQFVYSATTQDSATYRIKMVKMVDGKGCNAYAGSIPGTIEISLYRLPVAVIDNDLDTVELCADHHTVVALPDVGTGHWEQARGDDRLVLQSPGQDQSQISTTFNPEDNQYYMLYWVEQNWPLPGDACLSKDSIEIIFYEEPEPANIGGADEFAEYDSVIYFASYMHLFADEPTAGTGRWILLSGQAVIENDTLYNSYIDLGDKNLDKEVEFILNWKITNGVCPVTEDELRLIRKDLRIYEGFSPDGNNINDYFIIEGLDYTDTYDLKIYTRTGNMIYQVSKGLGEEGVSQDLIWDGNYAGGRPVENGIYYYTLEVTKGQATYLYKNYFIITRTGN